MTEIKHLVLASASPFRRAMLAAAGVEVEACQPLVDEEAEKAAIEREHPKPAPADIALRLAGLKSLSVSRARPGALVIGSDQVLAFEGEIFSKPASIPDAHRHLARLRGKTHELLTAVVLAEGTEIVWSHIAVARLTMRPFTDCFLDGYVERQGARLLATVGAYEIEGAGSQLFDRIEGDHFTIVGLPLLPLMAELRRRRVLPD